VVAALERTNLHKRPKTGCLRRWISALAVVSGDCRRLAVAAVASTLLAVGLAGCASPISEDTAVTLTMSPGVYDIYSCDNIAASIVGARARQIELEQLMARASQGTGGAFVSAITYRSEYLQTRATLVELKRAASAKQCATESKYSSGRAVF
jgi:hypothetical protein